MQYSATFNSIIYYLDSAKCIGHGQSAASRACKQQLWCEGVKLKTQLPMMVSNTTMEEGSGTFLESENWAFCHLGSNMLPQVFNDQSTGEWLFQSSADVCPFRLFEDILASGVLGKCFQIIHCNINWGQDVNNETFIQEIAQKISQFYCCGHRCKMNYLQLSTAL